MTLEIEITDWSLADVVALVELVRSVDPKAPLPVPAAPAPRPKGNGAGLCPTCGTPRVRARDGRRYCIPCASKRAREQRQAFAKAA